MKRYYQNLTHEPIKHRTWILARETVSEDELKWLSGFGISIRIDQPTHDFTTSSGGTHTIKGKPLFTMDTTTDKQRVMLELKFGADAVLLVEETVLPGTISTCTLDRIVW